VNFAGQLSNILIAVFSGGAFGAIVQVFATRRKSTAEAESIEADTAAKLLTTVSDELERLQARQNTLEARFTTSETSRQLAQQQFFEEQLVTRELRAHIASLQRAYNVTRTRVGYLTEVVRNAGLDVTPWTPPSGYESQEENG
jgi:chromosome segregation ATPase